MSDFRGKYADVPVIHENETQRIAELEQENSTLRDLVSDAIKFDWWDECCKQQDSLLKDWIARAQKVVGK